ncbi:hypothetical protein NQ315_010045 [Exocentrus adspersus]|uniref:Uncharacterized protein n=1 Tax=Exocentrus adspersus TaxID=1586481 RepID=A0AAV8WBB3_9CUCU|nr:hypothetical protein NQ315_010045 [Exocentrus adspersus]
MLIELKAKPGISDSRFKKVKNQETYFVSGQIPRPTNLLEESAPVNEGFFYKEAYIIIPTAIILSLIIFMTAFWMIVYKKRRINDDETTEEENELEHHHHHHEEKTVDRDNRRNCQQVYTSSPVKSNEKLSDDASVANEKYLDNSEEDQVLQVASSDDLRLQPPTGFSDSRELSEAECDRDLKLAKLPIELASILARYQERKEQERREFTIHV